MTLAAFLAGCTGKSDANPYRKLAPAIDVQAKANGFTVKAGEAVGEIATTSVASEAEGRRLADSELVKVTSTFRNTVAPYAGNITSTLECAAHEYLKQESGPEGAKVLLAVAGERHIFGSCSSEQIRFAAVVSSTFKNQGVTTIKLFRPVKSVDEIRPAQAELVSVLRKLMSSSEER